VERKRSHYSVLISSASSSERLREKVKEKVDSPYIYYFDAALIGFNLVVFLVKYITMYKLAW